MSLTQTAASGLLTVALPPLQSGRGVAEILLVLLLLAVVTTALAHRGIGGVLVRIARWVAILLFAVGLALVLL